MRRYAGYEFPAYILHEAALWSELKRQWVFLPRRMCKTPYDEVEDEKMGANTLFFLSEEFQVQKQLSVGVRIVFCSDCDAVPHALTSPPPQTITPERGFSTAKFVPGSGDSVIFALKSAEYSATDRQTSFATVFTTDGKELMAEVEIDGDMKYAVTFVLLL